jgi:hypothetical protein
VSFLNRSESHAQAATYGGSDRGRRDRAFVSLHVSHSATSSARSGRASRSPSAGEETRETGQWVKDLAAAHRTFADRLADRLSLMIPSRDPDYGDLGQAFPLWPGPGHDAILLPSKPEIRPSPQILQRAADRDADLEAAD